MTDTTKPDKRKALTALIFFTIGLACVIVSMCFAPDDVAMPLYVKLLFSGYLSTVLSVLWLVV